jgi:hypothetical protein
MVISTGRSHRSAFVDTQSPGPDQAAQGRRRPRDSKARDRGARAGGSGVGMLAAAGSHLPASWQCTFIRGQPQPRILPSVLVQDPMRSPSRQTGTAAGLNERGRRSHSERSVAVHSTEECRTGRLRAHLTTARRVHEYFQPAVRVCDHLRRTLTSAVASAQLSVVVNKILGNGFHNALRHL